MKLKIFLSVFVILLFGGSAHAGSYYLGTIDAIRTNTGTAASSSGWVRVLVTNPETISNGATCTTSSVAHYVFDGNTSEGKNMYALLLAAFLTNRTVNINGNQLCDNPYGNAETILAAAIQ
ncbi:MAG: hypothetical protein OEV42_19905 [Deltaproteobacteria bacterium]|nr:hypothetical protein [Deltaproteobacteria bacterium]